jgi:hypothetical protein
MTTRLVRTALSSALLVLGGCVVAPPPMAVAQQNCQQFTQAIIVNGVSQMGYGLQCLQPDGSWQIVAPAGPTPPALPPAVVVTPYPAYAAPYAYDPYYYGSPWYAGPEIGIGIGVGRGWHGGGWHGGGRR